MVAAGVGIAGTVRSEAAGIDRTVSDRHTGNPFS
jgi:hypothetical protein